MRYGITEMIAEVAILCIVLIVIVAAAWYIYSIYSIVPKTTPRITISSAEAYTNGTIIVRLYNYGQASDKLIKAEAVWWEYHVIYECQPYGSKLPLHVPGGPRSFVIRFICAYNSSRVHVGDRFRVKLYFERNGLVFYDTVAVSP